MVINMNQSMAKIAITLDASLLQRLDQLVEENHFKNRSQAFQQMALNAVKQFDHERLANECEKLDITAEQALADEGFDTELDEWPDY